MSRVALSEMMGSIPAFLRIILTLGPPGLIGGIGPVTAKTSTGAAPEVCVVAEVGLIVVEPVFLEQEFSKAIANRSKQRANAIFFSRIFLVSTETI
jgi:hypothetical protein